MSREDDIRVRLAAATPGSWTEGDGVYAGSVLAVDGESISVVCLDPDMDDRPGDRDLIAHAPADLAYLLDRVAELDALIVTTGIGAATIGRGAEAALLALGESRAEVAMLRDAERATKARVLHALLMARANTTSDEVFAAYVWASALVERGGR